MQSVAIDLPLELAAALQGINALLYYLFFRDIHPPGLDTITVCAPPPRG